MSCSGPSAISFVPWSLFHEPVNTVNRRFLGAGSSSESCTRYFLWQVFCRRIFIVDTLYAIALVTVNGEDRPIEKFGSVSRINSQTTSSKCFEYSPQLGSESPKKFLRGPRDQERKTQRCGICVQNPDLHFALSTEKLSLLALPLFTSPCCSIRLLGDVRHLVSRSWCGRSRGF